MIGDTLQSAWVNMLFLVAITILDGVFGVGLFFSGLLILGAVVYQLQNGLLSIYQIMGCVILGAIIADNIGFYLGRRAKLLGKKVPFKQSTINRVFGFMERLGRLDVLVIIFGRSFAYSRPVVPFLVGFTGTNSNRFLLVSVLSAFLWCGAWALIVLTGYKSFENLLSANAI